jgi:predicted nucleic acid-binding protein
MKAICNTSPIIGLSIIGHLELLWELFDIYIPGEVYYEIVNKGSD